MSELLTLDRVCYTTADQTFALKDISLNILSNEWVSVVGANGSGKSTLAKIMMGLLDYQSGTLMFQNTVLDSTNFDRYRGEIGYVFQNPDNQFVGITVEEDIAFGLENRQVPSNEMQDKIMYALSLVEMESQAKRHIDELSGGQKQRVALASALVLEPKLLILDEAMTMIDPKSRDALLALLKRLQVEKGLTIISITHHEQELHYADRVIVLEDGHMVSDSLTDDGDVSNGLLGRGESVMNRLMQTYGAQDTSNLTVESVASWLWTSVINK